MQKHCFAPAIIVVLLMLESSFAMDTLSVSWKHWEPHQYKDAQGKLGGVNIELITAILEHAGFQAKFVEVPWKRSLSLLENGKIDIAMSAYKSVERERFAYFSDSSFKLEYNVLFIRAADKRKYRSIKSLKDIIGSDLVIGAMIGGVFSEEYAELMRRPEFNKHIETVVDSRQNVEKLMLNRIDGFIADELFGYAASKKSGYDGKIAILFHLYGEKDASAYLMFSKKSMTKDQVNRINRSMHTMKSEGSYFRIINKYK